MNLLLLDWGKSLRGPSCVAQHKARPFGLLAFLLLPEHRVLHLRGQLRGQVWWFGADRDGTRRHRPAHDGARWRCWRRRRHGTQFGRQQPQHLYVCATGQCHFRAGDAFDGPVPQRAAYGNAPIFAIDARKDAASAPPLGGGPAPGAGCGGGMGGGGRWGKRRGAPVGGKQRALERDQETADQDRVAGRQAAAGVGKLRCAGRRGLPMQVAQRAGRGEPQGRQRAGQQQIDGQQQAQDMRLDHGLTRSTKRSNWIESFCGLSALTAPRVCTFRPSMMIAGFWLDITAKALCRAISSPSVRTASGIWSTLPCSLGGRTWLLTICKPAALKMSRMRCWALLPTWEASRLAAETYCANSACAWALAARDWSALP